MFFSKITLNKNSLSPKKIIHLFDQNDYVYHQLIWDLFSENNPDKKRDFLYRAETIDQWPNFYIVSNTEPHDKKQLWDIQIKKYLPKLIPNQRLYFKLRANPRIACKGDNGKPQYFDIVQHTWLKNKDNIIQGVSTKNQLMQIAGSEWLTRKAKQHGFKVKNVIVENFQKIQLDKNKRHIQFSTLDFSGTLTITDLELFHHTLTSGIGSAKGFGCGLLMVKL